MFNQRNNFVKYGNIFVNASNVGFIEQNEDGLMLRIYPLEQRQQVRGHDIGRRAGIEDTEHDFGLGEFLQGTPDARLFDRFIRLPDAGGIGWQNYFSTKNIGGNRGDSGTYNELWFNSYKYGNQYGPYIGMTYGRNADTPDFRFNVNSTAPEGGYTAKLTIVGTSETYRIGNTGNNYYRRKVFARANYTDGTYTEADLGEITKQDPDKKGMPSEVTWGFEVQEGKTISNIAIWTVKVNSSDTENNNTWALYYSIRFELK